MTIYLQSGLSQEVNGSSVSGSASNHQTAFPIDPNIVHRHKVARMPAPEQHRIVLKHEKITMPTWHHAGETLGTQTMSSPNQGYGEVISEEKRKDQILEEQQKEIDNLKRMVEFQQQQLTNPRMNQIQVSCSPISCRPATRQIEI